MSSEKVVSDKHETSSTASHSQGSSNDTNLYSLHELHAGRLIIDPAEAKVELGDTLVSRLKLTEDGTKILWPQPTDSPLDPQNWSQGSKNLHLFIITLAAIVPDFDGGIGIAALFALARQFHTTTDVINNVSTNWNIFLLGWGGLVAVMLVRRLGRLPVLFWSQLLALGFLVGCTFAPNLRTFAGMRCLTAFFGSAPQVTGLYIVSDMFPFHLQARKLNIWTMGFLVGPFLSPFAFGFLIARTTWRWAYGIGCLYSLLVLILIVLFMRETIYDRSVKPIPEAMMTGFRGRFEALVGITGYKMQKYRISWMESFLSPFRLVWRPHLLLVLVFEAMVFGFAIGITVTNGVFLGSPKPFGFGFTPFAIAGMYAVPIVAVLLGEVTGRYTNDFIMNLSIRRNKGVFEAESRLWACYIGVPLHICGFVTLGAALEKHLGVGAVIMGWGIAQFSVMINTVAVYAYCNDAFPKHAGEISALINLARSLGGFSVAYFQIPWALKHGAIQTFGCEAAIVTGIFVLCIPFIQLKGRTLRDKFSLH
jgi:MFS family permease